MTTWQKYARRAADWSERAYADPRRYLAHRAALVVALGPRLSAGEAVLDLACGDGGLADFLPELRYSGVDASPEMVEAARARGHCVELGDLNAYVPETPVAATTIFRAIYYASDRRRLFEHVAGYTTKKLVFDLNPRQYEPAEVRADLVAAGFDRLEVRPFFVPQTHAPPAPAAAALQMLERSGPLARAILRCRFTLVCAASRDASRRARS